MENKSAHKKKYEKLAVVPVCFDCDCTLCNSSIVMESAVEAAGQEIGEEYDMWSDVGFNHSWEEL